MGGGIAPEALLPDPAAEEAEEEVGSFFFFFFPGLLGFCDLDFCRVWGLGGIWETCWRTGSGYFYLCYLYHRLLQGLAGLGTRESIRIHRVRTENIAKLPALHLCMLEP